MKTWLNCACEPNVVRRAGKYALIVGIILILINQGDVLLRGEFSAGILAKMVLTMLVPYIVSTCSSVGALCDFRKEKDMNQS